MKLESCYKVGLIAKPHGLKGEVTVLLDDSPVDWETLESVFVLEGGSQLVPYFIEQISVRGDKAYVKFEDIGTPEAAAAISKRELFLPKSSRPKSGKGEFYDDEIIGFSVIDDTDTLLGVVGEVVVTGLNKLLSAQKDGKEVLIPVDGPFITSINKSKKEVRVSLPDGFLDI